MRLFWMGFGNAALGFAGMNVVGAADVRSATLVYALVVVLLAVARTIDVLVLGGTTTDGAPATRTHLYRYVGGLCVIAGTLWIVAFAARGGA